jgi:hypothetical protein
MREARTMRHFLIGGLMAALVIPAAAYGQPTAPASEGPALGDPAPAPPPVVQKKETKKPGLAEAAGGAVGAAVAAGAVATTGPVGAVAVKFVGSRIGSGAVSVAKKVMSGDGKDDDLQAPAPLADPAIPQPIPAADIATADAAAKLPAPDPVKLAPPPPAISPPQDQSIQAGAPAVAVTAPASSVEIKPASPVG